jgi:hypothetical protein
MMAGLSVLASAASADTLVQSFNANKNPSTATFYASEAGWFYTPNQSFDLTRVATRFASTDGRTVSVEVYTALPGAGGLLLGSADFVPGSNVFSGGTFSSAIHLDVGQDYFVGFRNISGLGSNITFDAGRTSLGPAYISSGGPNLYSSICSPSNSPILQFFTDNVPGPTPAPLPVSALGGLVLLAGVGTCGRRRGRAM